jgi:hypothetical protein
MSYEDYLVLQKKKTSGPQRIHKWQNEEWDFKFNGFIRMFKKHSEFTLNKKEALCLGARTGQEVEALRSMSINSIGVDPNAFPLNTIEGDVHDLKFADSSFDLVFTNT